MRKKCTASNKRSKFFAHSHFFGPRLTPLDRKLIWLVIRRWWLAGRFFIVVRRERAAKPVTPDSNGPKTFGVALNKKDKPP